ncbi:MAG: LuxR C-terminal-related transcriptional regulator [Candidatus Acidiferrales bacterium]
MASVQAKINIFLAAGNRLFRESLARIFRSKSDLSVVGCAPCVSEGIEQISTSGCDVLLVDPVSGERSDLSWVREIVRLEPGLKVMLIDMVDDESTFLNAVRTGVVGYILQNASAVDIVAGIRAVHHGEAVCPPQLCLLLFQYVAANRSPSPNFQMKTQAGLTRREQQLVPLIAQGLTNKEIASQLNLSEQTIKNHIHRILQRMGASDRFAVVERVREQNALL